MFLNVQGFRMASVGSLQEQALKRKEKLKAFREKKLDTTGDTNAEETLTEAEEKLPR